jgi:Leucine-rich repeat (LRR) protein
MRAIALLILAVASVFAADLDAGFHWVSDADLDALLRPGNIRKLDLSFSLITDLGMERLRKIPSITDLNLYAVEKITDVGISYIRDWKNLERLNLHGADITDTSVQQYVSGLTALKALDISFTMGNLKILDLAETAITDRTLTALAANKSLRKLYLSGSQVTSAGVEAFRRANPQCEVSWN